MVAGSRVIRTFVTETKNPNIWGDLRNHLHSNQSEKNKNSFCTVGEHGTKSSFSKLFKLEAHLCQHDRCGVQKERGQSRTRGRRKRSTSKAWNKQKRYLVQKKLGWWYYRAFEGQKKMTGYKMQRKEFKGKDMRGKHLKAEDIL